MLDNASEHLEPHVTVLFLKWTAVVEKVLSYSDSYRGKYSSQLGKGRTGQLYRDFRRQILTFDEARQCNLILHVL